MSYKLKSLICGVLLLASVVLALGAFTGGDEAANATRASFVSEAEPAEFILREHNGCIAIFLSGSDKSPISVTDIELKNLRKVDSDQIRAGLRVKTEQEVLELLEDLGS